jgi:hypothetical protein
MSSALPGFAQPVISINNQSAFVANQDLAQWTAAINQQIATDVTPVWGVSALVTAVNSQASTTGSVAITPAAVTPKIMVCTLYDGDDPTSQVLGDHYVDKNGLPGCEINVASSLYWGQTISVVLSHEIIEMLVNPWLDGLVVVSAPQLNPGGNYLFFREVCDPVQGYTYQIGSVAVSDFVYPAFWQSSVSSAQMDKLNLVHVSLTPAAGFLSYRYTSGTGLSPWQTMYGAGFSLGSLFTGQ